MGISPWVGITGVPRGNTPWVGRRADAQSMQTGTDEQGSICHIYF